MKLVDSSSLEANDLELLHRAQSTAQHAYNPYSGFLVGAALRAQSGDIFTGTFFECASYPAGVCAERVAIGAAISAGQRRFAAIAIVGGDSAEAASAYVTPCGICRQCLYEFISDDASDIVVICSDMALSHIGVTSVRELLPHPFTSRHSRRE